MFWVAFNFICVLRNVHHRLFSPFKSPIIFMCLRSNRIELRHFHYFCYQNKQTGDVSCTNLSSRRWYLRIRCIGTDRISRNCTRPPLCSFWHCYKVKKKQFYFEICGMVNILFTWTVCSNVEFLLHASRNVSVAMVMFEQYSPYIRNGSRNSRNTTLRRIFGTGATASFNFSRNFVWISANSYKMFVLE